jgi:hypothetical protein
MYKKKNRTKDNYETRGAKNHIIYILVTRKWKLKTNTINGEYNIDKKLANGNHYRLDSYFVSPEGNHYIIEYDGLYHFTPKQMSKAIYRDNWLTDYFSKMGIKIKIAHFAPDELFGKFKLPIDEIMHRILNSELYKISLLGSNIQTKNPLPLTSNNKKIN